MANTDIIQQHYSSSTRRSLPNGHLSRTCSTTSGVSRMTTGSLVIDDGDRIPIARTLFRPPDLPDGIGFRTMPVYDDRTAKKVTREVNGYHAWKTITSGISNGMSKWNSKEKELAAMEAGTLGLPVVLTADEPVKKKKDDPWEVDIADIDPGTKWSERTQSGKVKFVLWTITKIVLLIGLLYLFICALDFLSTSFRLLGGEAAGEVLQNSELLSNPVCGLMIGVLVTVLVQSSSTSTSIVVSMASAGIISVKLAIPIIMGANIGTSVTNTIVSLGQAKAKDEFRRAFGGATVHDMFNWLSVLVLLPIEVIAQPLYRLTYWIVHDKAQIAENNVKVEILKVITKPFTSWVIQIDKKAITRLAEDRNLTGIRLLKTCERVPEVVGTLAPSMTTAAPEECDWHWFAYSGLSDTAAGISMLAFSLALLCICLVCIVKTLHSLLKGGIAIVIKKFVNADFPGYTSFLTGYLAIIIGALCTFVVQSSSIFTSALTPLVGIGVISLERMYPLTLGSNIGTTATGIIAALPNSGSDLANALQVALSHFFFNIFGIMIWYPIPFMRVPAISMARVLGNTTAKYRWFALFYLAIMFFIVPALAFCLSIAGDIYLFVVGGLVLLIFLVIVIINAMQRKVPRFLPSAMRTWDWLPWWMHSLKPLDHVFGCRVCCKRLRKDDDEDRMVTRNGDSKYHENGGLDNNGVDYDTRM